MKKRNKKIIFIFLILTLFLISLLTSNINPKQEITANGLQIKNQNAGSCIDTDNGLNYLIIGDTTNQFSQKRDQCPEETFNQNADQDILAESYCDLNNETKYSFINCKEQFGANYTCQNGACIFLSQPPQNQTYSICQNQQCIIIQGSGTNQCISNSDCVSAPATCADTDNGINYTLKGTLTISNISSNISFTDRCEKDGRLIENWCTTNTRSWGYHLCGPKLNNNWTGCNDGACVPLPPSNETNTTASLPDLAIESIFSNTVIIINNESNTRKTTVFAVIKNIGPQNASQSQTSFLLENTSKLVYTPQLAPNQSFNSTAFYYDLNFGNYSLTVNADSLNQINESNEFNNNLSTTLTI